MEKKSVRLSKDVVPKKYEIHLKPDLSAFTFEGEETIHLTLAKPTKTITLHAIELEIDSAEALTKSTGFEASKISYDKKYETATIVFPSSLPKGAVRLKLAFRGTLNDKMHGFYRSSYRVNGETKYLATTQFESNDARRAFPCFDEPAMKSVFDVSLTAPSTYAVVSNTIETGTRANEDGTKTVVFAPTPKMSTYLLAFIVGDLDHIEKKSKDGVLVRVFTTPGKTHQAQFALDCAVKVISFFNGYFDIPYPMPVLDLIAIPDFAAGAMENWGAITYRETALLVDQEHSSTMNKQWVALVIGHEIAHQWFGNLVTMEWWTHLWLNEGFASYIEYLAVDHLFPEWDIWTQFLDADFGRALTPDALKHTHAIEVEVHDPAEIAVAFDAVSYSKGASIIRMLAEYLGEKNFRDGLRHYLKKHAYGNTETADLWNALAKVSGKPVAKMMANWTGKAGYPLVSISGKGTEYEIRQSRFFSSPISEKETHDKTLWSIPVRSVQGNGTTQKPFLFDTRSMRFPKKGDSWLKINADETAFQRTLYPADMLGSLARAVSSKRLPTRDRLGLIRDIMAIAETGKLSTTDGLEFADHYRKETEYVVWGEIASGLARIRSLIAKEPFLAAYDAFALNIFSDIRKKATWNTRPKDHAHALLKVLVLDSLGRYGDKRTIAHARTLFAGVNEKKNPIPPDLRGVVYNIVAKYGGGKEHAKLTKLYSAAALHEEKNRLGRALGAFTKTDLLQKTLAFSVSNHVRPQDTVRMIAPVTVNPKGRDLSWRFVKKNWSMFIERYAGSRDLSYLLEPFATASSEQWAKDIRDFLRKRPAPGVQRTVSQIMEHIHSNAAWLSRDRKALSGFLRRK
jgi:puromycin-sensitive aminopeptidase